MFRSGKEFSVSLRIFNALEKVTTFFENFLVDLNVGEELLLSLIGLVEKLLLLLKRGVVLWGHGLSD